MKLPLLLAIICFTLYGMSYCSHGSGSREKRGLSEVQKRNLVDALNKDRQEIGKKIGVHMKTLTYDHELEQKINTTSPQICSKKFKLLLRWDSVGQEYYDALSQANKKEGGSKIEQSRRFFFPNYTSVACSNTYHCSKELDKYYTRVPEMIGKTVQFYGMCMMRGEQGASEKIWKVEGLPPISKYADIIGVQGLDKGSVSEKDMESGFTGGSEDGKGSENGKGPEYGRISILILTLSFIFNL
ncbi:unnamed protein product [Caenorhabditis brenneri]